MVSKSGFDGAQLPRCQVNDFCVGLRESFQHRLKGGFVLGEKNPFDNNGFQLLVRHE